MTSEKKAPVLSEQEFRQVVAVVRTTMQMLFKRMYIWAGLDQLSNSRTFVKKAVS